MPRPHNSDAIGSISTVQKVMSPLFQDMLNGTYKLEDITLDVGIHQTVVRIVLHPTGMLKVAVETPVSDVEKEV